jgi:hypothetical protein
MGLEKPHILEGAVDEKERLKTLLLKVSSYLNTSFL